MNRICAVCGALLSKESARKLWNDEYVCAECAQEECRRCAKCGGLCMEIGMTEIKRKSYCQLCADEILKGLIMSMKRSG